MCNTYNYLIHQDAFASSQNDAESIQCILFKIGRDWKLRHVYRIEDEWKLQIFF